MRGGFPRTRPQAAHGRWGLWLPVGLGCGIALYFSLPQEPPLWWGVGGLAGLAGLTGGLWRHTRQRLTVPLPPPADDGAPEPGRQPEFRAGPAVRLGLLLGVTALATMALGFTAAQWRTALQATALLEQPVGPLTLEARVAAVIPRGNEKRLLLDGVSAVPRAGRPLPTVPPVVRLTLPAKIPPPQVGDPVRVLARLMPPPLPAEAGAYDFPRQAFFQGIGAVGQIFHLSRSPPAAAGSSSAWRLWAARARQIIAERVAAALPESPAAAITATLLHGEAGAIPESALTALRLSGLTHLLSISGLHIGLVAGLVFVLIRSGLALSETLALRWPISKIAAVAGFLVAAAYAGVVGFPVPTQRALLSAALVLLAVLADRDPWSPRLIAFAATVVLLLEPESLLSPSFQMSFAAVTVLFAAHEVFAPRLLAARERLGGLLAGPVLYGVGVAFSSLAAGCATLPFTLYHFQQINLWGLLANMIAVPLTAFWIMPWALAVLTLLPLGGEAPALRLMNAGVAVMLDTATWTAGLPGADFTLPAWPLPAFLVTVAGGLGWCLTTGRRRQWGLVPVLAGLAVALPPLNARIAPRPDLLLDGEGRLLAVRAADGERLWIRLGAGRGSPWLTETWAARDGLPRPPAIRGPTAFPPPWNPGASAPPPADPTLLCDPLGCLYQRHGWRIAIPLRPEALTEDCRRADVVLTRFAVRHCRAALVVTARELRAGGTLSLFLAPGALRRETVAQTRGQRPWTPRIDPRIAPRVPDSRVPDSRPAASDREAASLTTPHRRTGPDPPDSSP